MKAVNNTILKTGIILVNKPRGLSSFTVVNIVRKRLGAKKAGHLGTLDVAGEGLLPVALDKATCLFDYYLSKDKIYKTVFEFGWTTDTLDLEGKETNRNDKIISREEILKVIPTLEGKYPQMPPQYSAKKINGQKAYDIARSGGQVELKPKEIRVYSIKLLQEIKPNVFEFEIHCSSGTYIRSIARDMADRLSTFGVMQSILRTKCSDFTLENAYTLEEIKKGNYQIINVETLFDYTKIYFNEEQTQRLKNGQFVKVGIEMALKDGVYKAYYGQEFLGVFESNNKVLKFIYKFM